jgi:acetolactate decarboxylase
MKTKNCVLSLFFALSIHFTAFTQSIYQVSYYQALFEGKLDGIVPMEEIIRHGDTGLGGFNALDGEMILVDGKMYQVLASGKVITAPDLSIKAPFAEVCYFKPQKSITIVGDSNLYKIIDRLVADPNVFVAIKIKGTFEYIKVRSIPAQHKPYPTLSEIVKTQPTFEKVQVKGTIVGFRTPSFAAGINTPGYHLHFVADDISMGGHVLEVRPSKVICEIMVAEEVVLKLPIASQ